MENERQEWIARLSIPASMEGDLFGVAPIDELIDILIEESSASEAPDKRF